MSGAEIVQSSFDYETSKIGPYTLPVKLSHVATENVNNFQVNTFYKAMMLDERALAVFNVNNYCLCVVTRNGMYEVSVNGAPLQELEQWTFQHPLNVPVYEHVGYVKTYHKCLTVYQFPTYLVRELGSNKALGFEEALPEDIVVNPPLSVYKQLIQTDAAAACMRKDGSIVLLSC